MDAETQHRISGSNEQAPSAEDWQATIDRLREVVCILLMKNETMRMTLSTEREKETDIPTPFRSARQTLEEW
jgi:hypothetical protein